MGPQNRQHGFSLAEALIATGILAIVVSGVMTMIGGNTVSDLFRGRMQAHNSCLAEANRILNNFKEKGLVRSRFSYPVTPDETAPTTGFTVTTFTGSFAGAVEQGITNTDRWDTALLIYGTPVSSVYPLRPSLQIMGYMNALQAIFNSNPSNYCPTTAGDLGHNSYGDGTLLNAPTSGTGAAGSFSSNSLENATAWLKIQPFNTVDGQLISCAGAVDLHIRPARPAGSTDPTIAQSRMSVTTNPPNGLRVSGADQNYPAASQPVIFSEPATTVPVENRGWAVTISIQHTDRSGSTRECSVQEKFQYSMQNNNTFTYEFEDMDGGSDATPGDDSDIPDGINSTIRMNVATPPAYDYETGGADLRDTTEDTSAPINEPLFYGCSSANYNNNIALRLKNIRPGSIMMCRNLSFLRPQPTGSYSGVESANHMPVAGGPPYHGQRNTFYSTEILQNDYFSTVEDADSVVGDLQITGFYYPASWPGESYYCRTADGCTNLPRFARGYLGTATPSGGTRTTVSSVAHDVPVTSNANAASTSSPFNAAPYNQWVPCETINVCADSTNGTSTRGDSGATAHTPGDHFPAYAGFVAGNKTNGSTADDADAYHLKINDLPVGCEVHLQIAEVDAAYNVKVATFKEYIHEKAPGNWLCRAGSASGTKIPSHNDYEWFFSCGDTRPDRTSPATPAPLCSSLPASNIHDACCIPYPFGPSSTPYIDP